MKDEQKTKTQLIEELTTLRGNFAELEVSYQAVVKEKRKYEEFLDNTDDYCFETDLADNITFCNMAAYRMFGYERDEYLHLERDERYESLEDAKRVFQIYNEMY